MVSICFFIQMQMGIYWNLLFEPIRSKADRCLFSRKVFEKCAFHGTLCNWCYAFKWHVFLVLRIFSWHFEDFIYTQQSNILSSIDPHKTFDCISMLCWTMQMDSDEIQNINAFLNANPPHLFGTPHSIVGLCNHHDLLSGIIAFNASCVIQNMQIFHSKTNKI